MKALFKILAGLLLLLVVILVAAIVVIPMVVDPNDFKPQISEQVKKATGRDLTIEGDISLSVFPWLGLELGHTTLSNHAAFGAEPMLEIGQAGVRVKLMPLLQKELIVDRLKLDGAVVRVGRLTDGTTNWSDLAAAGGADEAGEEKTESDRDEAAALAGLAIGGLDVTSARLIWDDAQSGSRYELAALNLVSGEMRVGRPIDLDLNFNLESSAPAIAGAVALTTQVTFDPDRANYLLKGLLFKADLKGETLPGGALALKLQADVEADLAADAATLSDLQLELFDLALSGDAAITGLQSAPMVEGQFKLADLNPRTLLKTLGQVVPDTADSRVLNRLGAEFSLNASADKAELSELLLRVDDSILKGSLSVSNFAAPASRFDLALDQIDLDRYMPPASEAPKSEGGTGEAEPVNLVAALAPVATLDLQGTLKAGQLMVSGLTLSDLVLSIKARGGVARLAPLSAKLYDGTLDGRVTVDASTNRPVLSLQQTLSGVQIAPLVKDLADNERVSGVANISVDLSGAGRSSDDLLADLDGNLKFSVVDGKLNGINIDRDICRARGALKALQGGAAESCDPSPDSHFSNMRGSAVVTNGVVQNQDLLIQQVRAAGKGYLQITGGGSVNLPKQTLDYRLEAARAEEVTDAAGVATLQIKGNAIPVRVSGSLESPSIRPDVAGVVKEKAKTKLFEALGGVLGGGEAATDSGSNSGTEADAEEAPAPEPKEQLKQQLLKGLFGQ
ncbi:MAG: AsmA family protein [Gammaproteobacteria bacterium]|nr:AsmA family protein [Gammaproteobacteria bacterium]